MRLGVIGFEAKGLLVAGYSIIYLSKILECKTQVAVCLGFIRFDSQGLGDQINGDVVLPSLECDHPQKMQGGRLIGVNFQHLFVDVFSLRQTAHCMVLQGEV